MRRRIWFFVMIILTGANLSCSTPEETGPIETILEKANIPGMAACVVDSGRVVWSRYYGYADIEDNKPVTEETIFMLASVSKTITAAAVMLLVERDSLKLDGDINDYLPFAVRNPYFPDRPITIRSIMRHTSSIADNRSYLSQFWSVNTGDPTIPLNQFLKDYLTADGANFSDENFLAEAPGTTFSYSNIGFALLGLLVEPASGKPFHQFCDETLFSRLDMNDAAWYLHELDVDQIAIPYDYSDSLKKFMPYPHGGYPDYPAGQLRTTAEQLSHFLIAWTKSGQWKGKPVFQPESIQTLTPDTFMKGFHVWSLYGTRSGDILYSHFGGDNGYNTFIGFNPNTKRGLIILMNGEIRDFDYWSELINVIYEGDSPN